MENKWTKKLHDSKDLPKVVKIEGKWQKMLGKGTCVIPAPIDVDKLMRKVKKGRLTTINQIRESLARKHNATIGCPITTGIFASIAARASEEEKAMGRIDITPYWRTLKTGGIVNPKYPGGELGQKKLLEAEGHKVIKKGKKWVVENFEKKLA